MPSLMLRAPAKINLCLRVLGRREDGFHEIDSLFVMVDLFDDLNISLRRDGQVELLIEGPSAGIPGDESNLAWKAARLFCESVADGPGATVRLRKRIPAGGGLGGGSSDAAQVLLGMNRLAGMPLGREELATLGAQLGSDVPFFLSGPAARVKGRGDRVTPVVPPVDGAFVLVFPGLPVSTAWAYGALGKGPLTNESSRSILTCSGDLSRPVGQWARELHNDFETTVFAAFPRLREIRDELTATGALGAVMTGSGSTMVGVYGTTEAAQAAAEAFVHEKTVVTRPLNDRVGVPRPFFDGA